MSALRAGVATIDITPAVGEPMACFPAGPGEPRRAEGIERPLTARALALHDGDSCQIFCACDLTLIDAHDVADIRAQATSARPALGDGFILVGATHTHSAPETTARFGGSIGDAWTGETKRRIAAVIVDAFDKLEPASLSFASAHVPLNHNRRVNDREGRSQMVMEWDPDRTTGPVDDELALLRVDGPDGSPRAILFQYTAHGVTLGPANRRFSPDYPGLARERIEAAFPGSTAIFFNGAAGDLHPRQCMRGDDSALRWMGAALGAALGAAAVDAAGSAKPLPDTTLAHRCETLAFPNRMDESRRVSVEVAACRIGPLVVGVLPGEIFVDYQLAFKQQFAPKAAFLIGYANGWPGYVPTDAAYDEGGYGVDKYDRDPVDLSRTALPRGAGAQMLEQLLACVPQT